MTVAELIAALQTMPPEAAVFVLEPTADGDYRERDPKLIEHAEGVSL